VGCGTGLVGICTALLGAHAILTDLCALPPRAPSPTLCHERALRCDDVVQVRGLESHLDVLDALKKASRSHGRRLLKLKRRFSLGAPHNAFFSSLVSAPSPPRRSYQLGSHAMRRETTGGVRYCCVVVVHAGRRALCLRIEMWWPTRQPCGVRAGLRRCVLPRHFPPSPVLDARG